MSFDTHMTTYIVIAAVVILAAYGVLIYNQLVALKHGVARSWANIDVLLKQRHDELPKLVESCRQYMRYEQETLERVMKARSAVSTARRRGLERTSAKRSRPSASASRRAAVRPFSVSGTSVTPVCWPVTLHGVSP